MKKNVPRLTGCKDLLHGITRVFHKDTQFIVTRVETITISSGIYDWNSLFAILLWKSRTICWDCWFQGLVGGGAIILSHSVDRNVTKGGNYLVNIEEDQLQILQFITDPARAWIMKIFKSHSLLTAIPQLPEDHFNWYLQPFPDLFVNFIIVLIDCLSFSTNPPPPINFQ